MDKESQTTKKCIKYGKQRICLRKLQIEKTYRNPMNVFFVRSSPPINWRARGNDGNRQIPPPPQPQEDLPQIEQPPRQRRRRPQNPQPPQQQDTPSYGHLKPFGILGLFDFFRLFHWGWPYCLILLLCVVLYYGYWSICHASARTIVNRGDPGRNQQIDRADDAGRIRQEAELEILREQNQRAIGTVERLRYSNYNEKRKTAAELKVLRAEIRTLEQKLEWSRWTWTNGNILRRRRVHDLEQEVAQKQRLITHLLSAPNADEREMKLMSKIHYLKRRVSVLRANKSRHCQKKLECLLGVAASYGEENEAMKSEIMISRAEIKKLEEETTITSAVDTELGVAIVTNGEQTESETEFEKRIIATFVELRRQVEVIAVGCYNHSTPPGGPPDGMDPEFFAIWRSNWHASINRCRSALWTALAADILEKKIFGLHDLPDSWDSRLEEFERLLTDNEDVGNNPKTKWSSSFHIPNHDWRSTVSEWRKQTIKCAGWLSDIDQSFYPGLAAQTIQIALAKSFPLRTDMSEEVASSTLENSLLKLCKEAYNFALGLRMAKGDYFSSMITDGSSEDDVSILGKEMYYPGDPQSHNHKYIVSGGLYKIDHSGTSQILERPELVILDRIPEDDIM